MAISFSWAMSGKSDDPVAGNASLLRDLALQRQSRMDAGAVGGDVDQRTVAEFAHRRVLRDQHVLVLLERMLDLTEQLFRRLRLVLAIAVRGRPQEPAGVFGLRGDAVEDA